MTLSISLYAIGALIILIGLAGVVLPALPGVPLMFAGMLLVAWGDNFNHLGLGMLILLGALTAIAMLLDFVAGVLGAKRVGASRMALIGAALGTLIGLFFGIIGIVLGPFVGAFLGELWHSRHGGTAAKVGAATWLGMVLGAVVKIGIAFLMLGVFALAFVFGQPRITVLHQVQPAALDFASFNQVLTTVSGLSEIDSIPSFISHSAKSG